MRADEMVLRRIRGARAGLILQDPKFSLNPVMTAGAQIAEAWRVHRGGGRKLAMRAAIDLLAQVQIRDPQHVAQAYPHELSGGMGQRVMIAMMLAPDPELLIADEPTSALDATVQAEILRLIEDLVSRRGMGLILISHDLPLVSHFCDRVAVMYAGRVVEELAAADLTRARHPYTRGLLECLPTLSHQKRRLAVMQRDPSWLEP
jgi:peptide/nickel transport system ATP-binding protein